MNTGATGRLARRYRDCQAFVHGSTGSLYAYQGERPLREDDPYGLHSSAENYAASKIGAEFLLEHLSEDYLGGTEAVTTQEYCRMAGEILGKEPTFVENSRAWPIWADTTKMVKLLGPNQVSMREGIRRVLEARDRRLSTRHHVIGEPAD